MKQVEISMKELLVYILRRWRIIIGFALLFALALGGYSFLTQSSRLNGGEASANIDFGTQLSLTIDLVGFDNKGLTAQAENTAKNDRLNKLRDRYLLIAQAAPLSDILKDVAGVETVDAEMINLVNIDSPSVGILIITVNRYRDMDTSLAAEAIYKYLQGYTDVLSESVSAHTISIIANKSLMSATADESTVKESANARTYVISMLSGLLVGFVLGVLYASVVYLIRLPLQTPEQVQQQLGIRYLGGVRRKTRLSLGDRLAGSLRVSQANEAMEMISANLGEFVGNNKNILVTGTISGTVIDEFTKKLALDFKEKELSFVSGPDINKNAETVTELGKCDAVVLVERIDCSQLKHVNEVKERIDMSGKEILGYILY